MEAVTGSERSPPRKRMSKQPTGKRDDGPLHAAARAGDLALVLEILSSTAEIELDQLLSKQNQSGETALYVAAEYGQAGVVRELVKHYDSVTAGIQARNGFDAFHTAAKQGDLEVLRILLEFLPDLSMTADASNTTALHTAARQGHVEVVELLLDCGSGVAAIARSNGKTPLHSAARNGHVEVVRAILRAEPGIWTRADKKGQTALHMAAKGRSPEVVEELVNADPSLLNAVDSRGNTALHIASRKGRAEIIRLLLGHDETDRMGVNRAGETALDTAGKTGNPGAAAILQEHSVRSAKAIAIGHPKRGTRELKQTVSDIRHEVHDQQEHALQTRRGVQGIAKRVRKMHAEGLNNAINSNTVVAVLIATVAFAAIFTVPGQYAEEAGAGESVGEANVAPTAAFMVFFVFDSVALFISLAVVVVQTSVVVIDSRAKKRMMAIINKLMWAACVLVSVAFLALAFIVVGERERWLAVGVTVIGATIMATTLGTMCFWVVRHHMEASDARGVGRRSSIGSRSRSMSAVMSDSEVLNNEFKAMYAI